MRLLITGATGFVGRNLLKSLSNNPQYEILCLVRDIVKAKASLGNSFCYATLHDETVIRTFNPECVIHLASYLTSRDDVESMNRILDANIFFGTGLLNALKSCKTIQLFLNFGSFAEYRLGPSSTDSAYLYTATKTAFRSILQFYADLIGFPYVTLVPYTIYGGDDTQKKIMDYIKDSFDAKEPVRMSPGEQILDFIHVDDVVDCILYILTHTTLFASHNKEVFHLGTGRGTSIRELAVLLEKQYHSKANIQWGGLPYRERDVMYAVAPIGKLLDLGWKAKIDINQM